MSETMMCITGKKKRNEMRRYDIYNKVRAGMILLIATLVFGCTSDNEGQDQQDETLQLAAYTRSYDDITRAVPAGYSPFTPDGVTSISIFMTTSPTGLPDRVGYFSYNGHEWRSNISLKSGDYYIYGFMPGDIVNAEPSAVSPLSGDFQNGAVMTLDGLKPVSKTDVCVIVGVKGVTSSSSEHDASLGQFGYTTQPKGQNYVNLLMDHIYSCLQFRMQVEDSYSVLRTIKLKKMELRTAKISATKAVITLTANTTGANPLGNNISWSTPTASTGMSMTLFESEEGEALPSVAAATPLLLSGNIMPGCDDALSLVCTYDVYDRKGNLIRKDCEATNMLPKSLGISSLKAGERQPIALTVAPTYLGVLSDPDLNNPDITFN